MLVLIYVLAAAAANLSIAYFGPAAAPFNALVLVALDLTARDRLHEQWHGRGLWWKMLALIAAGGLVSYILAPGSARIAVASFLAFSAAGIVDTVVYSALYASTSKLRRVNVSNLASAIVDSAVFLIVAFGFSALLIPLFGVQVGAKVAGGYVWSRILFREEKYEPVGW